MPLDSRAQRLDFYAEAARQRSLLAAETTAGRFLVDPRDEVVGRGLFVKQGRGEVAQLAQTLAILEAFGLRNWATSQTFLEAGANIGTSTIAAILNQGFSRAIAIEPAPGNLRLLEVNLLLNDVDDRVTVLPYALSSAPGRAKLVLDALNWGNHRLAEVGDRRSCRSRPDEEVSVEVASIDSLISSGHLDPDQVGLFWLDVQGHEGRVLAGAGQLLARRVPVVLEFYPPFLNEVGGWRSLADAFRPTHDRFLDLRAFRLQAPVGPEIEAVARPIRKLHKLAEEFAGRFTDILVLPRQAARSKASPAPTKRQPAHKPTLEEKERRRKKKARRKAIDRLKSG